MGAFQSKINEHNSLEDIKIFSIDEKAQADTLIIKSLQECVARIEKLEKEQSDKLICKLPVQLCKYSLLKIHNITTN